MNTGTVFPIKAANDWPVLVVGLDEKPRQREKTAPTGEPTFSTGCVLLVQSPKDGTVKVNKNASINVIEPAEEYSIGQVYKAAGNVWVTPYESNERIAYSITAQRLVPFNPEQPPKRVALPTPEPPRQP